MARGELMKRLLASYGRDDEFRAVAEQIIDEEEKKNNRVLARSLRKTLETGRSARAGPKLARMARGESAVVMGVERKTGRPSAYTAKTSRLLGGTFGGTTTFALKSVMPAGTVHTELQPTMVSR